MKNNTSETKHTPGPWTIKNLATASAGWPAIISEELDDDGDNVPVCEMDITYENPNYKYGVSDFAEDPTRGDKTAWHDQIMADAHLIAAAPDMLAALKGASRELHILRNSSLAAERVADKCDAAIAKAEGGAK